MPSYFYQTNHNVKEIFGENTGLDERSLDFLGKALEKNNLPGFDFLEFKKSISGLLKLGMDEPTAFKSAFTTAATMGFSKEKLIETHGFYRNIVAKEKEAFDAAASKQEAEKVAARQTEIARLNDQIERNRAEIQRLQDEMARYLTDVESAETAIKLEKEKLEKSQKAFGFTHQSVLNQLDGDLEKIHSHLA